MRLSDDGRVCECVVRLTAPIDPRCATPTGVVRSAAISESPAITRLLSRRRQTALRRILITIRITQLTRTRAIVRSRAPLNERMSQRQEDKRPKSAHTRCEQ
jgi:hypothetical protein